MKLLLGFLHHYLFSAKMAMALLRSLYRNCLPRTGDRLWACMVTCDAAHYQTLVTTDQRRGKQWPAGNEQLVVSHCDWTHGADDKCSSAADGKKPARFHPPAPSGLLRHVWLVLSMFADRALRCRTWPHFLAPLSIPCQLWLAFFAYIRITVIGCSASVCFTDSSHFASCNLELRFEVSSRRLLLG